MSSPNTIDFLLLRSLSKLHDADRQAVRLFSALARSAASPALVAHLQDRRDDTLRRVALLEGCAATCGFVFASTKCLVMEALLEETAELTDALRIGSVLDAGLQLALRNASHCQRERLADARLLAAQANRPDVLSWLDKIDRVEFEDTHAFAAGNAVVHLSVPAVPLQGERDSVQTLGTLAASRRTSMVAPDSFPTVQ